MTEPSPPRRRKWWKLILLLAGFGAGVLALASWYVTTASFQQALRQRVIAALEDATGGRVELDDFHTIPFRLSVDVRNLTIHGREAADQVPYLHVDRLRARLRIISLLSKQVGLRSLILERPVAHVAVYPDGSTNVPEPKVVHVSDKDPVEQLFALSASLIDVQHGVLLWEQNRIPLDFAAQDFSLTLRHAFLRQHYETRIAVGGVTTRFRDHPVLAGRADASLVLYRDHAEITALNVATSKSEVHFAGRVENFHQLQISGQYRGVADLAEFGPWLRPIDIRSGTVSFEGKGSWNREDFSADGTIFAKELDYVEKRLRLEKARFASTFSITPARFQLTSIKAAMLGGEITGELDVMHWQSSLQPGPLRERRHEIGRTPPGSLQRGAVHLQFAGFPVTPALQVVSSENLPLDRLNLSGAGSGKLEMQWVGSIRDAEVRVSLNVLPPLQPAPGEIPLKGQVRGVYRGAGGELTVEELQFSTPASEITAKGDVATNSSFHFSASSHQLSEWQPLLRSAWGHSEPPFNVHGFVVLSGTANGRLSAFQCNGHLEVYDFETLLPGNPQDSNRIIHWDSLTTAVQYSNNGLAARNGTLIHASTVAHFEASTVLADGVAGKNSPFTLHLDARHADLAEIARLAGLKYDVGGEVDLTATASGTPSSPHGEGHVEISGAEVPGVPIAFVKSDLRLAGGEIQFNNLEASIHGASLTGSGAAGIENNSFRANLAVGNLDLASFPQLQTGRLRVDGRADVKLGASGTRDHPSVDAHVHLRDLAFDKERAGDFWFDAVSQGSLIAVQGHSEFEQAELNVEGTVSPEADLAADLDISFHKFDVDSLLRLYLSDRVTGHATMEGKVSLRGPLRTPRDLKVTAAVDSLDAEIEHLPLHNAEPVRVELADETVRVEALHITGGGTDFAAHGTASVGPSRTLDLRLDGTINLALLPTFNPELTTRGIVNLNMTASGTFTDPLLQGKVEVKDANASYDDLPTGLSELNGVLLFEQNRVQIQNLTGKTGSGLVTLTGSAVFQNASINLDMAAQAQGVRLRYPPGISSTSNANLRLTGSSASALLSGDVMVTKLAVTPGFDFGAYLARSKQAVMITTNDKLGSHVKLDVHVATDSQLQMQAANIRLSGDADLRVRNTLDRPVITGRAEALDGEIFFNGTKYRIERLDVTFPNPARTKAYIDLQATARVRDYDITITVSGDTSTPNGLKPAWRSEPPLPDADIIALLAMGRTREEAAALQGSGSAGLSGEASSLLIREALNSTVGSRVQRLFGVSRLKIDPQGLISTTNAVRGPQVTIEQQVASNLTVTYSTNVSVASQQIIQVEYNVTRNVSVVALRDQNGVISFDIKIRQRKK